MTQGDPLYPMILNVVVDAIIHHWMMVVTPTEAGTGGLGMTIIDLAAYFYSDDGLVALTQPKGLHRAFNVLNRLFNRVGLRTHMEKTVVIVFQPCHAPGRMLEDYERRTTGKGPMFQEHQRRRVEFPECGVEVAAGALLTHFQSQQGTSWGRGTGGGEPSPPPPG